jgi:hypothetical protein
MEGLALEYIFWREMMQADDKGSIAMPQDLLPIWPEPF